MPVFIYLDEYPELNGHQSMAEYVQNRNEHKPHSEAERNFERLVKVAGLDPVELHNLLT
jgi:hypothetical protein